MSEEARKEADAIFTVSVAASLSGMHAQTLRQYDRLGLVSPARAKGQGRRYSHVDLDRLRRIQKLTQEDGMNLAGVQRVLTLEDELEAMRREVARLTAVVRQSAAPTRGVFLADSTGSVRIRPHATKREPEQGGEGGGRVFVPPLPRPQQTTVAVRGALELSQKRGNALVRTPLAGWQRVAALRMEQMIARKREGRK